MKFVDKQLALKLKEKGFDKPCFGYYFIEDKNENNLHKNITCGGDVKNCLRKLSDEKHIDAPTIEQVLEWLREEKYINFGIFPYTYTAGVYYNLNLIWKINPDIKFEVEDYIVNIPYKTYDDACIAGIEYVIENLI
jgi:hypothetical protein